MRITFAVVAVAFLATAGSAQAAGCLSGAVVGGVAGHVAGHGKLGAVAGCAIGHHKAKKQKREEQQRNQQQQPQG
ncbi:hypothetical protein [Alsobacter metallidurans]|nr:hypothetical protein [Alsobacter metallidurans]